MRIVPAKLTHVGLLANTMRAEDVRECRALGRSPKEALRLGLRMSQHALTAINDAGKPMAMFGVVAVSILAGVGRPWFLGSDDVFRHGRELLTIGPKIIYWWASEFPRMENIISADNDRAIRLLSKWGFVVGGKQDIHGAVAFVPFHLAIQAQTLNA